MIHFRWLSIYSGSAETIDRAYMPPRISPDQIPSAPDLSFEITYWDSGITHIAGIDEAGRGALAGPVAAAVVILPTDRTLLNKLDGIRDSKEMTPHMRTVWNIQLQKVALAWSVGLASQFEIDNIGILPATHLAAQRALDALHIQPCHLLLDYLFLPDANQPQTSLIKGDKRSLSVAAASILAKTTRDSLMCELETRYPGYGFNTHKGYGTKAHIKKINELGPSPAHRYTFHPVIEIINQNQECKLL
jgi:ribonuclease HII